MWHKASLTNAYQSSFFLLDVEIHHLETAHQLKFTNISVVSQGPLRAAVKAEVRYGQSVIIATVKSTLTTSLPIKSLILDRFLLMPHRLRQKQIRVPSSTLTLWSTGANAMKSWNVGPFSKFYKRFI